MNTVWDIVSSSFAGSLTNISETSATMSGLQIKRTVSRGIPSDGVALLISFNQCWSSQFFMLQRIARITSKERENHIRRGKYRGSSHNAVLLQRGFPFNTAVLVHVRGGVRIIYLINSSNTAYFEQAQKSALQEDPLYIHLNNYL